MEQDPAAPNLHGSEAGLLYVGTTSFKDKWLTQFLDLSLEFLMGRALDNAMLNVGMKEAARGKSDH